MEGPSNGGLLYHEVQEAKLCAVHCVNTVLQGPFFSEVDLAALASDLDQRERQMLIDGGGAPGDFLSEDSHNVSVGGDFSIQVLQKALEVWDLQVIPLDSPAAEPSKYNPELENAFICHLHDHWFCIRKVNGEWYNFNSLYAAPEHLSKFYLSAFLDTLKGCGWSIFIVRGNFPKECPISSEGSTGFGQWLTPEDAERITKSCNQSQVPAQVANSSVPSYSQFSQDAIAEQEEEDLNAAIAASLMDSSSFSTGTGVVQGELISAGHNRDSYGPGKTKDDIHLGETSEQEQQDLNAAIAISLMDSSSFGTLTGIAQDKGVSVDYDMGGSSAGATNSESNLMDFERVGAESSESKANRDETDSGMTASENSTMSRHDKHE